MKQVFSARNNSSLVLSLVRTNRKELQFGCGWRGLRTSALLAPLCSFVLLALLTSCHSGQELGQAVRVLTSDRWSKELGAGLLRERYVYTFHTNGTYSACVFSDYGTRPIRGAWRVTQEQGKIHLRLENEEAYYFCLWRDSLILYDKNKDVLVISGPHYAGEMELQRVKGKRSEAGKHHHHQHSQQHSLQPSPAHQGFCTSHSV